MSEQQDLQITKTHTNLGTQQNKIPITIFGESTGQDFIKNYIPAGYKVVMNLPLVKASDRALLAINVNGFIPNYHEWHASFSAVTNYKPHQRLYMLMQMIHVVDQGPGTQLHKAIQIKHTLKSIIPMTKMLSYRRISGAIGLGIRISSNTAQTGNLIFTHAAGVIRDWNVLGDKGWQDWTYRGITALNTNFKISNYDQKTFSLDDVSLQRHMSITTNSTNNVGYLDLPYLLATIVEGFPTGSNYSAFCHQFAEDFLLMGILSDLPVSTTNQLTLEFFVDYSNISFEMPMLIHLVIGTGVIIDVSSYYKSEGTKSDKSLVSADQKVKLGQNLK